jgi:hypothetical protein
MAASRHLTWPYTRRKPGDASRDCLASRIGLESATSLNDALRSLSAPRGGQGE